jgi:DNA processing protein
MDTLDLQLALGRASVSARRLRTALQRLLPCAGGEPTRATLECLIGQPRTRLESIGLSAAASAALEAPDLRLIARDRSWTDRTHARVIDAFSEAYPPLLAQVPGAPAVLYVRGDPQVLAAPQLAMVGSRHPTEDGRRTARQFAAHLITAGLTITSGLALGIDAASHEGALAGGGKTVAVLGNGLDCLYPARNAALGERIAERGALVSEFPPGTPPLRVNFPRRNRIVSGLALGTLVVEAGRESGSLVTAQYAIEQGREVFAIPGSIHNPLARGCHALIRQGAKLVEASADVLVELKFVLPEQILMQNPTAPGSAGGGASALDKEYEILLDALGFGPASIDALVERTGLASQSIASMLLILELEGAVQLQPGGRYIRIQSR